MSDEPSPIDLTRQAEFALGDMQVRPSTLEVACGAWRDVLEPKVMQVLVALAEAEGAVVSRNDLIARCWEGRVVGEDAINRAIGRLRKLAEAGDRSSFEIETVPRVGYRLIPSHLAALGEAIAPVAPAENRAADWWRQWRGTALVAVLAGALAITAAAWWFRPLSREWTIDTLKVVVSTPLYENDPALAPNGAMLAYAAGPAPFAWHIFLRSLPDGQPIQLTSGPEDDDMQPAWSRNSDQIAFIRHRDGQPCTIIVKPVPGGDERVVGHCREDDFSSLAWQGNALYFSDRPQPHLPRQIMRLDLASGAISPITFPPADINGDAIPVFSPDGRKMVFLRATKGSGAYVVLDLASGALTTAAASSSVAVASQRSEQSFAWIDDDTLIATAGGLVEPTLWAVPLKGEAQRLALNSQVLGRLSRGPGGVFAVETLRDQVVLAAPPGEENGEPQILEALSGASVFPDFAPDGRLAFAHASPGGRWEIWIQAPGGKAKPVTALGALMLSSVRWSPDGRQLAFLASLDQGRTIYVINADGTGLRLVRRHKTTADLAWTADGQALLYPVKDNHGWRLWHTSLAHPERAAPFTDYGWFAVNVSGNAIYAMGTRQRGIWRIDGKPHFVANLRKRCTEAFMECQTWLVQGDTLIFADHTERARPRLILHSLIDGTERPVPVPGLNITDMIARDPTTGKIVYVYDGLGDSDIALLHLTRK